MEFNAYRIMWIFVFFDLPTETKKDKTAYLKFRKMLLKNGFFMFQFSLYIRHCASRENMEVHKKRVLNNLPENGSVGVLAITDKQFGLMEIFQGKQAKHDLDSPQQLELF